MTNYQSMFVGRVAGASCQFACLDDGGFVIVCGGSVLSEGPAAELESGLRLFLGMIDRPAGSGSTGESLPSVPPARCA